MKISEFKKTAERVFHLNSGEREIQEILRTYFVLPDRPPVSLEWLTKEIKKWKIK